MRRSAVSALTRVLDALWRYTASRSVADSACLTIPGAAHHSVLRCARETHAIRSPRNRFGPRKKAAATCSLHMRSALLPPRWRLPLPACGPPSLARRATAGSSPPKRVSAKAEERVGVRGPLRWAESRATLCNAAVRSETLRIAERPPHPRSPRSSRGSLDLSPRSGERRNSISFSRRATRPSYVNATGKIVRRAGSRHA